MLRNITVGIDIGTSPVKVVVAELTRNSSGEGKQVPKILGTGLAESKGMRHGYILNGSDVTNSINMAVRMAEKNSGVKISKAYVSVGGIGLSSITAVGNTIVSRADSQITELDIEKASSHCENNIPGNIIQNQKILHSIPLSYKIDGKQVLSKSPLDMKGTKLEIKMLFITYLEPHLNDLLQAVDETGIDVIDVMASPIAASFVTLSKQQKVAGCVLANIGSETMSIAVFENNIPVSLEIFPIGGTDITNDIALGLKIPLEEAENVKIGAIGTGNYPKKKLEEIVSARLTDMFELIENHLKKIGRNGLLPAGIFIIGGSAGINSIEDFAKASLKLPSRIAEITLNGEKSSLKDCTWAVAYGLCVVGFSKEEKTNLGIRNTGHKVLGKIFNWVKQFLP